MQQPDYTLPCPNCNEPLPCSHTDGLLTDWCDSCNRSIFDTVDPDYAAQQMEDNREQIGRAHV